MFDILLICVVVFCFSSLCIYLFPQDFQCDWLSNNPVDPPVNFSQESSDEVLAILKSDTLRDPERQKDVRRMGYLLGFTSARGGGLDKNQMTQTQNQKRVGAYYCLSKNFWFTLVRDWYFVFSGFCFLTNSKATFYIPYYSTIFTLFNSPPQAGDLLGQKLSEEAFGKVCWPVFFCFSHKFSNFTPATLFFYLKKTIGYGVLGFTSVRKKTYKSSKIIDTSPYFFEPKCSPNGVWGGGV